MKKYRVQYKTTVWINVDVEAESKSDAIDRANEESPSLSSYVGNGGDNKLCGVRESNWSVEPSDFCDDPSEDDVYEIED